LPAVFWGIVEGTTERPRKPTVPEAAGGVKGRKQDAAEDSESASAAVTAQMISETTPKSTDSVYMSDFRRYLIQREKHIEKVGMATAVSGSLCSKLKALCRQEVYLGTRCSLAGHREGLQPGCKDRCKRRFVQAQRNPQSRLRQCDCLSLSDSGDSYGVAQHWHRAAGECPGVLHDPRTTYR
jgi:hypothetical protein